MIKALGIALLLALSCAAQTRTVDLSWTASVSIGITGYTISTATAATGPFTQIACTGTVSGSTCISGTTASTTSYVDTEPVGGTVWYQIIAVAAVCTPTTPVTQSCGTSAPAGTSTTIPPKPAIATVVVIVP